MIVDAVADLHGFYPELEGGDLLIVAGDLTANHTTGEFFTFFDWIYEQDYKKKIVIAGNHDVLMEEQNYSGPKGAGADAFEYLCDSGTEFEDLKIWGSPWTLTFDGINPRCTAFTGDEGLLAKKFALIPDNVDILITHGPPYGMRDLTVRDEHVGSRSLLQRVERMKMPPRLWCWGHIHEAYGDGCIFNRSVTKALNCSHVNEHYQPVNKPIRVIL